MKIQSIYIQGFNKVDNRTYVFDNDVMYVSGPNGSGKTTVLQAIQLALLGYIPGTNKNSNEIVYRHANQRIMSVRVVLKDDAQDVIIERTWTKVKDSVVTDVEITPDSYCIDDIIKSIELPIFNFNEFMDMTANKLKDWFINFLPKYDTTTDWRSVLSTAGNDLMQSDELSALIESTLPVISDFNLKGVDEIRKVNEYFKSALKFKKEELQRSQATIQSLIFYDDCDSTESIESVTSKINKVNADLASIIASNANAERNALLKSQLEKYIDLKDTPEEDDTLIRLKSELNDIATEMTDIEHKMHELNTSAPQLTSDILFREKIVNSSGICPFTQTECGDILSLKSKYETELEALKSRAANDSSQLETLRMTYTTLTNDLNQHKSDIEFIQSLYTERLQIRNQITNDLEVIDITPLSNMLTELQNTQAKLIANERYNAMIDTLTADKYRLEQTIDVYKAWEKLTSVSGLQSQGSATVPFDMFTNDMNYYIATLFDDATCKFNITSKANSFSFGITRPDDTYVAFDSLSSGEKCLYTVALLVCIIKQAESPLKIVMIDDLLDHLDDDNMERLFKMIDSIEGVQMIFAGVKALPSEYRGGNIEIDV